MMESEDLEDKIYYISFQAGMNQRYHQARAGLWCTIDRGFRIAVGVLALVGAMLAVVTATIDGAWWIPLSITIAVASSAVALVLNVFPFGEWQQTHTTFLARWTDIREEIEGVKFLNAKEKKSAVERIEARSHRLCGAEPPPNEKRLKHYEDEERKSRQPAA